MKNCNQVISKYTENKSGSWAASTISTADYKLRTITGIGLEPTKLYQILSSKGYAPYTIQTYFWIASRFEQDTKGTKKIYEWMQNNRLKFKNCYKKKERQMNEEQFKSFLDKTESNSDLFNFLILIGKVGLRKFEAFQITWDQIKDNRIEVKSGKGGKQRFIPCRREWFKNPGMFGAVIPANLGYWQFFRTIGFTPHDFRSFYATKIVNIAGMSIEDARDLLGHEDIRTTAKYLRANKDRQTQLIMENF